MKKTFLLLAGLSACIASTPVASAQVASAQAASAQTTTSVPSGTPLYVEPPQMQVQAPLALVLPVNDITVAATSGQSVFIALQPSRPLDRLEVTGIPAGMKVDMAQGGLRVTTRQVASGPHRLKLTAYWGKEKRQADLTIRIKTAQAATPAQKPAAKPAAPAQAATLPVVKPIAVAPVTTPPTTAQPVPTTPPPIQVNTAATATTVNVPPSVTPTTQTVSGGPVTSSVSLTTPSSTVTPGSTTISSSAAISSGAAVANTTTPPLNMPASLDYTQITAPTGATTLPSNTTSSQWTTTTTSSPVLSTPATVTPIAPIAYQPPAPPATTISTQLPATSLSPVIPPDRWNTIERPSVANSSVARASRLTLWGGVAGGQNGSLNLGLSAPLTQKDSTRFSVRGTAELYRNDAASRAALGADLLLSRPGNTLYYGPSATILTGNKSGWGLGGLVGYAAPLGQGALGYYLEGRARYLKLGSSGNFAPDVKVGLTFRF